MNLRYGALFDMDGVIVDSADYHVEAFAEWCREKCALFEKEYFRSYVFGKQNRDIFPMLLGRDLSRAECAAEDLRKEEIYRRLYTGHVKPIAGLLPFLDDLKRNGFGIAIATSGPPENVDLVLNEIGASHLFDAAITSVDISRGKPDPQVFLVAAEKLELSADRCVVFEDSPAGAEAAVASGAALVGVTTGHEFLPGAALMIDDFSQVTAHRIAQMIAGHGTLQGVS